MENSGDRKIILGGRIKALRKRLGLTLEKFAEPLSIKFGTVSDYERGKASASESVVRELEQHYQLNRNWLETGEGDMLITPEPYPHGTDKFNQLSQTQTTAEPGAVSLLPDPSRMTLEQKLNWVGLKTKDIRQIQEWAKLSEEEQDEELKRLCMHNIEKGRY